MQPARPARVWITRAEPGATATADRVRALGLQPLVAPLLAVRALETSIDLAGVGALAFTSAQAVRAFADGAYQRGLPVFAVGDATAAAARAAGFDTVTSADGDVAALIPVIAAARPTGVVLHPCGRYQAGDLTGGLDRAGLLSRDLVLYDTPAATAAPDSVVAALRAGDLAAVLLHSPRAAAALAALAGGLDLSATTALGLSPACLEPLAGLTLAARIPAARPREDALLQALQATQGRRGG